MNVNETENKRKTTKRKAFKQMTEAEFKSLKSLTDAGVSMSVVSRATGRSNDTLKRVSRATDFEHYRVLTKAQTAKYMHPAITHTPESSEEVLTAEVPQVSELTRIADALERLAEAWESTPNKRRLF